MKIYDAMNSPSQKVPIGEAAGRVAADFVAAFPPDIPLIVPGEVIDRETVEKIILMKEKGISITGLHDGRIKTIKNE
ncbi:MAG: hypothetical protein K6F99_09660 [Lachnospiraceae bacterium]|nr:hypothetical protein [Lachnospiraceae bacterium]